MGAGCEGWRTGAGYPKHPISSFLLTEYKTPTNIECIFVETSIRKKIGYFAALIIHIKVKNLLTT